MSHFKLISISVAVSVFLCLSPLWAAPTRQAISKTSCCCNVTITGTYTFFVQPAGESSTGPFSATFSQNGCAFKTTAPTSNGYQIYGTVTGNQVNFSQVVDGEEAEGYVLQGRGMARRTSGGAYIIAAVYENTNGVQGSWTASKAP